MYFGFREEQHLFSKTLGDLFKRECPPEVVRNAWSNSSGRTDGLWAHLAELGVLGVTVSEGAGGLSLTPVDQVLLMVEAGRAALPEPFMESTAVALPLLEGCPKEELKAQWLPKAVAGEALVLAGLEVNPYVPYGHQADLLLLARGDELHALTPEEIDFTLQPSVDRSRRLSRLTWTPTDGTRIATGETASGLISAATNRGALGSAAQQLGLAQAMLDLTVEYAGMREQFGRPIGSFQAVKHHLTNVLLRLEFAKPVVYRAAHSLATDDPSRDLHVSMAKLYADQAAGEAGKACLQVHGAIGYSFEHDLHLFMKRSWSLQNAWGSPAWHRDRVGNAILS